MSELGGGESATRVLVFEKGREAWKSQSHISAHFAPFEFCAQAKAKAAYFYVLNRVRVVCEIQDPPYLCGKESLHRTQLRSTRTGLRRWRRSTRRPYRPTRCFGSPSGAGPCPCPTTRTAGGSTRCQTWTLTRCPISSQTLIWGRASLRQQTYCGGRRGGRRGGRERRRAGPGAGENDV